MKRFLQVFPILLSSALVVWGFIVDPMGVIHSSILYVFAICIVNASALEGVDLLKILDYFKMRKENGDVTDSD